MKYATIFALAGTVIAQDPMSADPADDYFDKVCMPTNATGYPDLNAPCNAVFAIQLQCSFGPEYLSQGLTYSIGSLSGRGLPKRQSDPSDSDTGPPPFQSNTTQRTCICESQFFDQLTGCVDCSAKHGNLDSDLNQVSVDSLASFSSSYCAASNTPTAGFADVLYDYGNSVVGTSTAAPPSTFSDPLGNMTQVSLYFTPKVTGTAAWIVAEQTASGTETFTAVNTQDGQIRPTGQPNNAAAASPGSTTTTGNAAIRTEAVAAAGVIGFAGLVALL